MQSALRMAVGITHLFTCAVALGFSAYTVSNLPDLWKPHGPFHRGPEAVELAITALALLVYGATSVRALFRVVRRRPILSAARMREHPLLTAMMTLGSLLSHFLVANVFLAIWRWYPDFDGNAAGPLGLAALLYAFAMLVGEFVLAGARVESLAD